MKYIMFSPDGSMVIMRNNGTKISISNTPCGILVHDGETGAYTNYVGISQNKAEKIKSKVIAEASEGDQVCLK